MYKIRFWTENIEDNSQFERIWSFEKSYPQEQAIKDIKRFVDGTTDEILLRYKIYIQLVD